MNCYFNLHHTILVLALMTCSNIFWTAMCLLILLVEYVLGMPIPIYICVMVLKKYEQV